MSTRDVYEILFFDGPLRGTSKFIHERELKQAPFFEAIVPWPPSFKPIEGTVINQGTVRCERVRYSFRELPPDLLGNKRAILFIYGAYT